MLAWSAVPVEAARRWVHVAGAAWVAACIAIWWQTALGRAVIDLAGGAAVAAVMLIAVWALTALRALVAWRQAAPSARTAGV